MSLKHQEFEDFENFQVTISKSSDAIYLRLLNKVTYQNYEVNIQSFDLQSIPIKNLENVYIFMIKCFEKKPKHNVTIEIKMEELSLQFLSQLEEYFEIKFGLNVPLIIQTSDVELSTSVMRLEAKQKGDVEMLIRRMNEMEKMLNILNFTEICIGDVWVFFEGWCPDHGYRTRTRTIQRLYLPFSIKNLHLIHKNTRCANNHSEIQNLGLDENHNTIQRQNNETYIVNFNHLYWNKLKLLPNLKKIHFTRDLTAEQSHNGMVGDDNSRFPNPFDFGILNNDILEDLTIVNFPGLSTLTTIEKIQSLKILHIDNADQLSNASEYIKKLPNLKKVTFSRCPKIISEDSGKLNKYCADNSIQINIS